MRTKEQTEALAEISAEATFGPASLRSFDVALENFTGPFDLLLRLIASKQMELTQVALAAVTDEFLEYIRRFPDLTSATDFLVVAATLLNMKSASLLPGLSDEDLEDEDLEARDLLFARLLQYRALQDAAEALKRRWDANSGAVARHVPLQEPYKSMLPDLRWTISPEQLAVLAAHALVEPVPPDEAEHVAKPTASFEEELAFVSRLVASKRELTFARVLEGARTRAVVVTRFLAVLQLFRDGQICFQQPQPMGELVLRWGSEEGADE